MIFICVLFGFSLAKALRFSIDIVEYFYNVNHVEKYAF